MLNKSPRSSAIVLSLIVTIGCQNTAEVQLPTTAPREDKQGAVAALSPAAPPPPPVSLVAPHLMSKMRMEQVTGMAITDSATGVAIGLYPMPEEAYNTEEYGRISENAFMLAREAPRSTFSIDVDRASYSNVRRFLVNGQRPPRDAVRIEEMVNYFDYEYAEPTGAEPFAVHTEVGSAPWNRSHKLLRVGLQARRIATENLPPSNLTFLVDVSGSMASADKLPLLKSALTLLVDELRPQDRVAIVVYAGSAGLTLDSTSGANKGTILAALENLEAGGSTAGGEGIRLAYDVAKRNMVSRGNNRVILCSDGDFNVGVSSDGELEQLIEQKRADGIYLTVLGFGTCNIKDSKMELLADKGNGNYSYIDTIMEAKKTLVHEIGGTLFTVAKDVKLQVEFNPSKVMAYRLLGYENRMLRDHDFKDDAKDAGEIGAGHSVTALYEIVPVGGRIEGLEIDPLKYQAVAPSAAAASDELVTLKIRYKPRDESKSTELAYVVRDGGAELSRTSEDFRFAAAVAEFGLLLRDSKFKGDATYANVLALAQDARMKSGNDSLRDGFVELVRRAASLEERAAN